jgi:hypothetical protein
MSSYRVTGIAVEKPDWRHEHITDLVIEDRFWVSRDTAIANITSPYGDRYWTYAKGQRAEVIVVGCPVCAFGRYLRTSADSTTENNLLDLPKYDRAA